MLRDMVTISKDPLDPPLPYEENMNLQILNVETFMKQFGLDEAQYIELISKDPPRLDIEGEVFFKMDQEFTDWLEKNYSTGGNK